MLKLYKNINGQLHYWETWDKDEKSAIVHWGIAGDKGNTKTIESGFFSNFRKKIQKEIDAMTGNGYTEFDDDNIAMLLIEYKIEGMGTEEDLDKRHRLENRMDEVLGWTGLGDSNGGSIGSNTMEVGCSVVDFKIAKAVIENDLKGTEFDDYFRIYNGSEE